MMDTRISVWNLLHDGELTAVFEETGAARVFVSIPYLRRRMMPLGDSFVLTLSGVTRMEFHAFDGSTSTLRETIEVGRPEILSTESASMPVTVDTTMGRLILDFESICFALDTGESIEYDAMEKACEEYWAEWEAKAEQTRAADARKPSRG
jgi:hypothetical protein